MTKDTNDLFGSIEIPLSNITACRVDRYPTDFGFQVRVTAAFDNECEYSGFLEFVDWLEKRFGAYPSGPGVLCSKCKGLADFEIKEMADGK